MCLPATHTGMPGTGDGGPLDRPANVGTPQIPSSGPVNPPGPHDATPPAVGGAVPLINPNQPGTPPLGGANLVDLIAASQQATDFTQNLMNLTPPMAADTAHSFGLQIRQRTGVTDLKEASTFFPQIGNPGGRRSDPG